MSDTAVQHPAPVRVAVTGAAGQIGYSLVFRIASGQLLGPEQPVILQMLEIPPAMGALEGVAMELDDCAFGLLAGMELTAEPETACARREKRAARRRSRVSSRAPFVPDRPRLRARCS